MTDQAIPPGTSRESRADARSREIFRATLDAAWETAHHQLISEMVAGEIPDGEGAILSELVRVDR